MKLNQNSLRVSLATACVALATVSTQSAEPLEAPQKRAIGFVDRVDNIMQWIIVDDYFGSRHRFCYRDLTQVAANGERIQPTDLILGTQVTVLYHAEGGLEHADRVVVGPAHLPGHEPILAKKSAKTSRRQNSELKEKHGLAAK